MAAVTQLIARATNRTVTPAFILPSRWSEEFATAKTQVLSGTITPQKLPKSASSKPASDSEEQLPIELLCHNFARSRYNKR